VNNHFQRRAWLDVDVKTVEGKGFGVFAKSFIPQRAFIMEFTGEIISYDDLQERTKKSASEGQHMHMYMIELKSKTYIDCRRKGSIARFINHSCEPNCRLEVWTVGNRLRVGVFATEDIQPGEELGFDYQWAPSDMPPTKCYCGKPSCRGFLEIFSSESERAQKVGYGEWVSARLDNVDEETPTAEKLVGKKVKVWSEDDEVFIQGKVLEYSGSEDLYSVYCFESADTLEMRLTRDASNWYWFDESRAIVSIKKKVSY
jgi:[histone H3]-lysine36 N-trimethyltransferase